MNWHDAEILIRQTIAPGINLDNRTIIEGPDFSCKKYNYNGAKGFKVQIGKKTFLDIPFTILQAVFEDACANNRIYNNKIFRSNFEKQCKTHGCHVHVVGKIFVKAGVATQIDKRNYKIL